MDGSDAYIRGCAGGSGKRVPSHVRVDVARETCGFQVPVPIELDEKRRLERRGEVGIVIESRTSRTEVTSIFPSYILHGVGTPVLRETKIILLSSRTCISQRQASYCAQSPVLGQLPVGSGLRPVVIMHTRNTWMVLSLVRKVCLSSSHFRSWD